MLPCQFERESQLGIWIDRGDTMDKCCASCFWCFTPFDEEGLSDLGYSEDDPNKPQSGDCVIGMKHNAN